LLQLTSSSGLRGRRRTYLTILKRAWSANFKAFYSWNNILGLPFYLLLLFYFNVHMIRPYVAYGLVQVNLKTVDKSWRTPCSVVEGQGYVNRNT
jgi:hypothetical protein